MMTKNILLFGENSNTKVLRGGEQGNRPGTRSCRGPTQQPKQIKKLIDLTMLFLN